MGLDQSHCIAVEDALATDRTLIKLKGLDTV